MTDNNHPITPPPELVQQWYNECPEANEASLPYVATQAARWAADQELEACLTDVSFYSTRAIANKIRAARRPKPPSLKEQALEALDEERADMRIQNYKLVRSVLESLPD